MEFIDKLVENFSNFNNKLKEFISLYPKSSVLSVSSIVAMYLLYPQDSQIALSNLGALFNYSAILSAVGISSTFLNLFHYNLNLSPITKFEKDAYRLFNKREKLTLSSAFYGEEQYKRHNVHFLSKDFFKLVYARLNDIRIEKNNFDKSENLTEEHLTITEIVFLENMVKKLKEIKGRRIVLNNLENEQEIMTQKQKIKNFDINIYRNIALTIASEYNVFFENKFMVNFINKLIQEIKKDANIKDFSEENRIDFILKHDSFQTIISLLNYYQYNELNDNIKPFESFNNFLSYINITQEQKQKYPELERYLNNGHEEAIKNIKSKTISQKIFSKLNPFVEKNIIKKDINQRIIVS